MSRAVTRERPYHRGNTRADAIAIARRLLAEQGRDGVTTVAVAAALGVSRAALARAFPSIDDLLAELVSDGLVSLGTALAHATAGDDGEQGRRGTAMGRAYLLWALANPHLYALIFRGLAPGSSGEPRPLYEESGKPVPGAFAFGLPEWSGDPASNPAFARWAMLHGLALLLTEGPLQDLDHASKDRLVQGALVNLSTMLDHSYP